MPHQQIIIHRLLHDLRNGRGRELDERVVLRLACALVAREPEARDVPELREVGAHLVFVEPVWDSAEVEDAAFGGLGVSSSEGASEMEKERETYWLLLRLRELALHGSVVFCDCW